MENFNINEQQKLERVTKRVKAIGGFYKHLSVYILVNLFLIALQYFQMDTTKNFFEVASFSTPFWWGIGLVFHALGVFGTNVFLGQDWEEKKINALMNKKQSTKWE